MLILTRKIGEKILINDDVEITVIGLKGNEIKLGINAPTTVKIQRKEIQNKNNDSNTGADS